MAEKKRKMSGPKYRYELKYVCSDLQMRQMEERISVLLKKDQHVGEKGYYTIRSLYFDDYLDSAFREKEDGDNPREKYRIRYYDGRKELIHLEIKRKVGMKIQKESCEVTEKEAEAMMRGDWYEVFQNPDPTARRFYLEGAVRLFQPKIIVEYDRVPYIGREGNVRITFDKNIRSCTETDRFWEKEMPVRPIMAPGQHLVEVKFDEFLPDWIYRTLQMENMTQTAFSKYCLCRKYKR